MNLRQLIPIALLVAAPRLFAAEPPPVEDFLKRSEFLQLALSPDGKKIAALVPYQGRHNLVTLDVATRKAGNLLTGETVRDVVEFTWINNNRLIFSLGDLVEEPGLQRDGGGLLAINADGTELKVLTRTVMGQQDRGPSVVRGAEFLRRVNDDSNTSDDILVLANDRNLRYADVYRMNTKTGAKTLLTFDSPGNVYRWVLDHDDVPRAAMAYDEKGTLSAWYRASAESPWQELAKFDYDAQKFSPIGFEGDNKTLLVSSSVGRDKQAIFHYDLEHRKIGELVVGHEAVDVSGGLIYDRRKKKNVGIRINAYRPETYWFDEDRARVQKMTDTALPGTVNNLTRQEGGELYLVTSYSDVQPTFWSLLDLKAKKIELFAKSRSWINPEQMSEMKPVVIKARDGLEIPAYLTVPRGSSGKNLPMILHPHGGPWARDYWGYNREVQFLASRGYAVLQPNFRMSTGFGNKHFRSGFKQWGLAMQDDLTDAVQWAIGEGIADKNRICIYGASYGGYAALMGLIKTPELYKCGVNYVGVTNLEALYNNRYWERGFVDYPMKARLGDPDTDKELLRANSPLYLADKIDRPLFMAYGGLDANVLAEQGFDMRKALDRANRKYEWMFKPDEAHGYIGLENNIEYHKKLEAFFKAHIGG